MNAQLTREQRLAAALRDNLKRRKAAPEVPASSGDASADPAERDGERRDDGDRGEDEGSGR